MDDIIVEYVVLIFFELDEFGKTMENASALESENISSDIHIMQLKGCINVRIIDEEAAAI